MEDSGWKLTAPLLKKIFHEQYGEVLMVCLVIPLSKSLKVIPLRDAVDKAVDELRG